MINDCLVPAIIVLMVFSAVHIIATMMSVYTWSNMIIMMMKSSFSKLLERKWQVASKKSRHLIIIIHIDVYILCTYVHTFFKIMHVSTLS